MANTSRIRELQVIKDWLQVFRHGRTIPRQCAVQNREITELKVIIHCRGALPGNGSGMHRRRAAAIAVPANL